TVCVMDASGRLGAALVRRLLLGGYAVHAAVNNQGELQRYEMESSENSRLRVFHSDPLDYHSIIDALRGCSALFYSFEPPADHSTYDEFMTESEVRAAHNVLEACAQTDTIDKVVFTSSATAVIWKDHRHRPPSSDDVIDEKIWSDVNLCRKFKLWYGLSKTVAEKTAWALAMDRGVNMVSINAGLVMRPDLSIKDPYLLGAEDMFNNGVFVTVDLKFLVDAHMCIFEDPSSYGRYLCFNHAMNSTKDVVNLAETLIPPSSTPNTLLDDERVCRQRISNAKLSKLMKHFDS
ncbi:hypothetical protein M569_15655, partial [Genlisea aurea]